MTYVWDRFDIDVLDNYGWNTYSEKPASDGVYVKAEDAINREAVNADKIRLLEVQLKEMTAKCVQLEDKFITEHEKIVSIRAIANT